MHESQEIAIVYTQRNELSIVKFAHITSATGTRYIQGLEVTVPCRSLKIYTWPKEASGVIVDHEGIITGSGF